MLETLDHTIRIGSTPTFLYFDLYLYSAYAAHCVLGELEIRVSPHPHFTPPALPSYSQAPPPPPNTATLRRLTYSI